MIPQPITFHTPHLRRKNNRQSIHAIQSEKLSLGEAAKLVSFLDCPTKYFSNILTDNFQEMASLPTKTPVSVLQELLSRRGITPKYELVQIEGAIHEPIFRYRVYLSTEYVATGTGRSKKEAKHAAAKNLLDLLVGKQSPEQANASNGTPGANDM